MSEWMTALTEREQKEVELACLYVARFGHGTVGHNGYVVIAKLARLLDEHEAAMTEAGATEKDPGDLVQMAMAIESDD